MVLRELNGPSGQISTGVKEHRVSRIKVSQRDGDIGSGIVDKGDVEVDKLVKRDRAVQERLYTVVHGEAGSIVVFN
ncbi:hypothetical protein N7449_008463 [Penicillium cf. viridicatum]|uniref:Uncharacterized protein n=1 Tax=Penicillium cf. viridicatum TaxID=2972119 RepID=A0A9W9JAH9_9EURO|nr:hypothetical protein N7449_008463 [Penicillium cf. viridicatum]